MNCHYCGRLIEYLPWRCRHCGNYFCDDHRLPEMHDCPELGVERSWEEWTRRREGVGVEVGRAMEEFEGESVVLTELEDALRNKTPTLLSKSLLSETDIIRLPVQLNPFTEANLRNALWYALREYNVRGEANLKGGRIDLLCEHAELKVGIECKSDFKNVGEKDFGYEAFVDAFYLRPSAACALMRSTSFR